MNKSPLAATKALLFSVTEGGLRWRARAGDSQEDLVDMATSALEDLLKK